MAYVGGLGFPVPRVKAAAGTDLVMERLDGPTLAEALVADTVEVEECARILADLHARLLGLLGALLAFGAQLVGAPSSRPAPRY